MARSPVIACLASSILALASSTPASYKSSLDLDCGEQGLETTRRAIWAVLSQHLSAPLACGLKSQDYSVSNMSLEDLVLCCHISDWQEGQTRDPDVQELIQLGIDGSQAPSSAEPCEPTAGYVKTILQKRKVPDLQWRCPSSVKKTKEVASSEQCSSPAVISHVTASATNLPYSAPEQAVPQAGLQQFRGMQGDVRADGTQLERRRSSGLTGGLDALRFNISSSGWQGKNFSAMQEGRQLTKEWMDFSILHRLKTFERIPYAGLKTRIRDCEGRLWFVRTLLGEGTQRLLPAFEQQASAFVTAVEAHRTGFTDVQMEENSRGPHWFSICGHDRNCKSGPPSVPGMSPIGKQWINCGLLVREFPLLAKRIQACADALGIQPLYGFFFNFCLNAARPLHHINRVHCSPHVDWKNLAIGVCVIFVYGLGQFDSTERSWLVIWEAGVIIEMPAGVFVMYPSSLFFHFNVDICDVTFVSTNGELPTVENSSPLNGMNGRGSCVWFNQASMFQKGEIGFSTIAKAKRVMCPTNVTPHPLSRKGFFQ
ncbi:hypothetical protein BD769DRAFT_1395324 [Suillus cothurnatus]|nr:hypothetical protein BD769DRAFT_1395324 [Suillus cothurnatus]